MAIIRQSLGLIRRHPKLLTFPLLSLICILVMVVFFAVPLILDTSWSSFLPDWQAFQQAVQQNRDPVSRVISPPVSFGQVTIGEGQLHVPFLPIAAFYLLGMFLSTYLNVAFYREILRAFNGERVSISRGLAFAATKLRAILLWSLLAGIVGIVIRRIEERVGAFGRWIMALVGIAWSVASVFAIPVIIRERQQVGPVTCLKTSAAIIKRNWGEGLTGLIGISAVTLLLVLALMAASALLTVVTGSATTVAPVVILGILAVSLLAAIVRHVFVCGLYVYATEGVVPGSFDQALLDRAWKVRQRK